MKLLITGGAGFIGSAVIRHVLTTTSDRVVNVDKLTYAGNLDALGELASSPAYAFERVDICERARLRAVFEEHAPDAVMHLAAESHVDRSIDGPAAFVQTNIVGTFTLLETAHAYWRGLSADRRDAFRFHHVSTDEVFGELGPDDPPFDESSAYAPSSPYAASKASADHLVRAWQRTYGLPVCTSNCSNNYGPFQYPEKLIPLMILNAVEGKPLPVYGRGDQVRDWLFVEDHARALYEVATRAEVGASYNIGGGAEMQNIDVVHAICAVLEERAPDKPSGVARYDDLIQFVTDRPGHDRRYAIDCRKIRAELGWRPSETFATGLSKTVAWYLDNLDWCRRVERGGAGRARQGRGDEPR